MEASTQLGRMHSNAVNCVKGEIHNVVSVMRLNRRWASEKRFQREVPLHSESPLLRAFKTLHNHVSASSLLLNHQWRLTFFALQMDGFDDLTEVDTVEYLQPFLDVVESHDTNGVITGAALSSINKFLLYGFISPEVPRAGDAVNRIAAAAAHCRFESSSAREDESTLLRLLEVLGNCLRCASGPLLTDDNVWEMVQCCFRISQLEMASHLLEAFSETALAQLTLTVFSRVNEILTSTIPRATSRGRDRGATGSRSPGASGEGDDGADWGYDEPDDGNDDVFQAHSADEVAFHVDSPSGVGESASQGGGTAASASSASLAANGGAGADDESALAGGPVRPYGIAVLTRLLSWLAGMTDPSKNDESTRVTGLGLINVVLEAGGESLGSFPSLVRVCQAEVCKFLVQNSRTEQLLVLSLTLRVVFNLFQSMKEHLKVQLEVFFTSVHLRIADSKSAEPEQRELAFESLLEFSREPALMLDLYINYDCDVACTNLFETLCRCLCRNAVPEQGPLTSLHILSLEGVLAVLESMARRCTPGTSAPGASGGSTPQASGAAVGGGAGGSHSARRRPLLNGRDGEEKLPGGEGEDVEGAGEDDTEWLNQSRERTARVLEKRKQLKRRMMLAAARFNTDKKGWVKYAQSLGLLPTPADAVSVAKFLRTCPALDKELLGLYISEPDDAKHAFNTAVRKAYVDTFDFKGCGIDAGLRVFLESFRLPGEAQKIERLMEAFSARFYAQEPGPLAASDTAFILAYSIIMLNTDLHNDQVAKKMTLEQFVRNNRGINEGEDLPLEYLKSIYDSIRDRQITLQADVNTLDKAAGQQWDGIMRRQTTVAGASFTPNSIGRKNQFPAGAHEREMFKEIATPAIGAISVVFELTSDEVAFRKALIGFEHCAAIATYYDMTDLLNKIVVCLCKYLMRQIDTALESPVRKSKATTEGRGRRSSSLSAAADGGTAAPPSVAGAGGPDKEDDAGGGFSTPPPRRSSSRASSVVLAGEDDLPPDLPLEIRRALITLRAVFALSLQYANSVQEGWRNVIEVLIRLHKLDALPSSMTEMDDFRDPFGAPLPSAQRETSRSNGDRGGGGLWSSVSSLLWSAADDDDSAVGPDGTEQNPVARAAIREVGKGSAAPLLILRSSEMSDVSLGYLLRSLVQARDPLLPGGQTQSDAVQCVELLTKVALRNTDRLHTIWPLVLGHFERIVSRPAPGNWFLLERVIVNTLRACTRLGARDDMVDVVCSSLRLLSSVKAPQLEAAAPRIAAGVASFVHNTSSRVLAVAWPHVHDVLHNCQRFPLAAPIVWDSVSFIVQAGPPLLTPINFAACARFLLSYAEIDTHEELVRGGAVAAVVRVGSMETPGRRMSGSDAPADSPGSASGPQSNKSGASGSGGGGAAVSARQSYASLVEGVMARPLPQLRVEAATSALQLVGAMVGALTNEWPGLDDVAPAGRLHEEASGTHGPRDAVVLALSAALARPECREVVERDDCWLALQSYLTGLVARTASASAHVGGPTIAVGAAIARAAVVNASHVVLSPPKGVPSSAAAWERCFLNVLFPLAGVRDTSAAASASAAPAMEDEEYRVVLTRLLNRAFLFAAPMLVDSPQFQTLWLKLVGYLAQFVRGGSVDEFGSPVPPSDGSSAIVFETTMEALKNLFLVVSSERLLEQASKRSGQDLLALTWTILESVCPWLRAVLAPFVLAAPPAVDDSSAEHAATGDGTRTEAVEEPTPVPVASATVVMPASPSGAADRSNVGGEVRIAVTASPQWHNTETSRGGDVVAAAHETPPVAAPAASAASVASPPLPQLALPSFGAPAVQGPAAQTRPVYTDATTFFAESPSTEKAGAGGSSDAAAVFGGPSPPRGGGAPPVAQGAAAGSSAAPVGGEAVGVVAGHPLPATGSNPGQSPE